MRHFNFASVYIYKYEDRPGTTASKLPEKISKNIFNNWAIALAKESSTHNEQFGSDGL
jgi:tRNA A37 methylthiotransferase MiaB